MTQNSEMLNDWARRLFRAGFFRRLVACFEMAMIEDERSTQCVEVGPFSVTRTPVDPHTWRTTGLTIARYRILRGADILFDAVRGRTMNALGVSQWQFDHVVPHDWWTEFMRSDHENTKTRKNQADA